MSMVTLRNDHYAAITYGGVIVECSIHTPYREGEPHMSADTYVGHTVYQHECGLFASSSRYRGVVTFPTGWWERLESERI